MYFSLADNTIPNETKSLHKFLYSTDRKTVPAVHATDIFLSKKKCRPVSLCPMNRQMLYMVCTFLFSYDGIPSPYSLICLLLSYICFSLLPHLLSENSLSILRETTKRTQAYYFIIPTLKSFVKDCDRRVCGS